MKQTLFIIFCVLFSILKAQTSGSLTLTFTQTPHTSFQGTKNVIAVWIQSSTGTFVKTRARNVGNVTKDHLPTWAVNSGGTAGNATSANCNVVGATSGATAVVVGSHLDPDTNVKVLHVMNIIGTFQNSETITGSISSTVGVIQSVTVNSLAGNLVTNKNGDINLLFKIPNTDKIIDFYR